MKKTISLTVEEMQEMHAVQLKMFDSFTRVCELLNVDYFMLHGSLLGTIKREAFFPFDDDIDVGMLRKDYDIFIEKAQDYFPKELFLQSCVSEKEYPLQFAKIRNSETAFIQPVMERLKINQGIYIDIFPIDFVSNNVFSKVTRIKERIYSARISSKIHVGSRMSIWHKVAQTLSVVLCHSWEKAVRKRAGLYSRRTSGNTVIVYGGKNTEKSIPFAWFADSVQRTFEGRNVKCPIGYVNYLERIYGDFENYDPASKYMEEDRVNVSASIVSVEQSYKEFI